MEIEKFVDLLKQWLNWEIVEFWFEEFNVWVEDLNFWDDVEVV